jgi:hypothetical protein
MAGASAPDAAAKSKGVVSSLAPLSAEVARTAKGNGADSRQQALSKYWTPARMKAAKPDSELPSVKAAAAAKKAAKAVPNKAQGPAVTVPAAAPKFAPKAAPAAAPEIGTQSWYPNYPVGHPVARTYGKVFFTSFGVNYVCSGTIVNSEGKSEVWTAGHCVSSGQQWNANWTFVPNYYNGVAPYGYWYAYQLWTTNGWFYNNQDWANDVGAAVMHRNNGYRIAEYLGAQGIAWNWGVGLYVYAFGYPAGAPFNGQYLVAEAGYTYNGSIPGTIYMVNNMTGGSSGGAWLANFDGNWGYINGHNDFKYNNAPQYMYSPYYGNQVANLYNTVRNITT